MYKYNKYKIEERIYFFYVDIISVNFGTKQDDIYHIYNNLIHALKILFTDLSLLRFYIIKTVHIILYNIVYIYINLCTFKIYFLILFYIITKSLILE